MVRSRVKDLTPTAKPPRGFDPKAALMSYEEIEVETHGRWNRDKTMNGRRPALAE
jgi:hypothetical protein